VVKVARRVQGWDWARGIEWKGRLEREEARKIEAAREAEEEEKAREAREAVREAEEEEKAREAREATAARNRVSAGAGSSEREVELETRGGVGEARGDNGEKGEIEAAEETPKKTTQAMKEKTAVAVAEVPGVQLGVAWDARDLSQMLGVSTAQVSNQSFSSISLTDHFFW
jgi:hypothetical protein